MTDDDRIIPSFEDAADRWMNAYLTVKDERDELKERLAPLLAAADALATAAHRLSFSLIAVTKHEPPMYDLNTVIAEYDSTRAAYRAALRAYREVTVG